MNIAKDLKDAVKAGRIDRAEAWTIHDLRIERKRVNAKWKTLSEKMEPLVERLDAIDAELQPLEAKAKGAEDAAE